MGRRRWRLSLPSWSLPRDTTASARAFASFEPATDQHLVERDVGSANLMSLTWAIVSRISLYVLLIRAYDLTVDADDLSARLVGTWRLVAAIYYNADGAPAESPLGADPTGLLIYTSDGHVAVLVSHADRRLLSVGDRLTSEADERADAFATFFSYGGRYVAGGDEVRHRVDVASIENWVGSEFIRKARLDGGRLFLRTPPTRVGGAGRVVELIWERADAAKR